MKENKTFEFVVNEDSRDEITPDFVFINISPDFS